MNFLYQVMNPTIEQWHAYSPYIGIVVLSGLGMLLLMFVSGPAHDES